MDEFKWIQIHLILVAVHQPTAVTGLSPIYSVRVGDDVTLACGNVIEDQSDCDSTTWTWTSRSTKAAVELIKLGQIAENTGFKSDRLSVGVNCALVIKKVTEEDAGYFVCQQYKSDRIAAPDAPVYLSVISMTEQMNGDEVTLICSVSTFDGCRQTVKWLFDGVDVEEHNQSGRTSDSPCTASVTVPTYHEIYKARYKSLECSVGDRGQLFPFKLQPSDENPGEVTTESATATFKSTRPTENNKTTTESGVSYHAQWRLIVVSVVLSALILTVVTVSIWAKMKGKQTHMDENMVNGSHEDDDAVNYENVRSPAEE
nr:uncharacterized protein LOC110000432 [Labrus bergylta]